MFILSLGEIDKLTNIHECFHKNDQIFFKFCKINTTSKIPYSGVVKVVPHGGWRDMMLGKSGDRTF